MSRPYNEYGPKAITAFGMTEKKIKVFIKALKIAAIVLLSIVWAWLIFMVIIKVVSYNKSNELQEVMDRNVCWSAEYPEYDMEIQFNLKNKDSGYLIYNDREYVIEVHIDISAPNIYIYAYGDENDRSADGYILLGYSGSGKDKNEVVLKLDKYSGDIFEYGLPKEIKFINSKTN